MSDPAIDSGLTKIYIDANFGLPVSLPNTDFDVPNGDWDKIDLLPFDSQVGTLGDNGKDVETGIFQVTLSTKSGNGDGDILDRAKVIKSLYQQTKRITFSGVTTRIGAITIRKGFISDDWYKVPVDINYISFLTRG